MTGSAAAGRAFWVAVLVIMVGTAILRWRLLDVPLERDEGEYAVMGKLILDGVPPYAEAYNMKLPGIYFAYAAVLAVFGETIRGIHLGLLFVNAATIVLVALLARRLAGSIAGGVAAAAYAVFSVSSGIQGFYANAEHFVNPLLTGGLLALVAWNESERVRTLVCSGLLLGCAIVTKQQALVLVFGAGLYVIACELRERRPIRTLAGRAGIFTGAVVVPYLVTCLAMAAAGVFQTFWTWTFTYARTYTGQVPIAMAWPHFEASASVVFPPTAFLWVAAAVGATAILWSPLVRARRGFLATYALFSIGAVSVGFFFRPHYFVLALPVAAVLVGVALASIAQLAPKAPAVRTGLATLLCALCVGQSLYADAETLFRLSPEQVTRKVFPGNPFTESVAIGDFVRARLGEDRSIAVIGSEPQIYFYADRPAATGFLYTYALMEEHPLAIEMQRAMIREIEESAPDVLVYVDIVTSWLPKESSSTMILQWLEQYVQSFRLAGRIDIVPGGADFHLDGDLTALPPPPYPLSISIFERVR